MSENLQQKHVVDFLFTVALLGLFLVMSILLMIGGVRVYQKTTNSMSDNYNTRTAYAYLTEKIQSLDSADALQIEQFGEGDSLTFTHKIGDSTYITHLYFYDGEFCELLVPEGKTLSPAAGQKIFDCEDFHVEKVDDKLYHATVVTKEESLSVYMAIRSGGVS